MFLLSAQVVATSGEGFACYVACLSKFRRLRPSIAPVWGALLMAWFSRSYLTDLVAMGRETSSLRSHPDNVLASPLCHSSHQSTPSGVGRFPSRNVATVENSRYASRKLERAKDSIRKARSPRASAAVISRWRRVNAQTWCLRHPHIIHTHHDVLARRRRLRIAANRVAIRAPEACHPRHFAIIAGLRDSR